MCPSCCVGGRARTLTTKQHEPTLWCIIGQVSRLSMSIPLSFRRHSNFDQLSRKTTDGPQVCEGCCFPPIYLVPVSHGLLPSRQVSSDRHRREDNLLYRQSVSRYGLSRLSGVVSDRLTSTEPVVHQLV